MERTMPKLVISHSHKDDKTAKALVKYLLYTYELKEQEIRCTSMPENGIEVGEEISHALKTDLQNCAGVIALLTYAGLHATYVKYELGASWILEKPILAILGPDYQDYEKHLGPIKELKYVKIEDNNIKAILFNDIRNFLSKVDIKPKVLKDEDDKLDVFINDFINYGNVQVDFKNTDVKIITPESKTEVNRKIDVRIERDIFPAEGFLWVAVGNERTGEYWPKVHLAVNETTCTILEGGNPEPGELGVWLIGVGIAGHIKFEDWYRRGVQGAGFPPFNVKTKLGRVPGAVRLAISDELIINKK